MLREITSQDVIGKRILVRIDLNLPRKDGKILDYTRIERSLKTINFLISKGAKVIILSHLGRPKGSFNLDLSLAPIADVLEKFLMKKVLFASNLQSRDLQKKTQDLENGAVLLLENLRFYEGEEKNDPEFVSLLASLGDLYVNDSFSCAHRCHASTYGIAKILPSFAGFLLTEELAQIQKILLKPKKPLFAIIGGSKISSKISLIQELSKKADCIAIVGAMAHTFLKSAGYDIGASLYEVELLEESKKILKEAEKNSCKILLPHDFIISDSLAHPSKTEIYTISHSCPNGKAIYDIGPESTLALEKEIEKAETIIWNGPLGAFETHMFDISSRIIARKIAHLTKSSGKTSIAGGGDTLAVIKTTGLASSFSYISTGGGAFLEWLEGKEMPAIKILEDRQN